MVLTRLCSPLPSKIKYYKQKSIYTKWVKVLRIKITIKTKAGILNINFNSSARNNKV